MSSRTEEERRLQKEIKNIEEEIIKADRLLKSTTKTDTFIKRKKTKLLGLIDALRSMADKYPAAAANISIDARIAALQKQVNTPNLRQQHLYPVQQEARAAAAGVILRWGEVTPGVSLNDLTADAKERLMACTTDGGSPFQSVLNAMIQTLELENQDPKVITARLNFAIALFQAMVPQFCWQNIPTITQVEQNDNNVRDLLECIAIVACNKCQESVNPLAVFAEAAVKTPGQFVKDAGGVGFALGALREMAGPTGVSLASEVPSLLFKVGKYMVTNPLASFTTYQVAEPYITSLLQKVFGERFGSNYQTDDRIRGLFNELSEHYLSEGVTDIIGFPPADTDSLRNKLSQMLYNIGYRGVASMQKTSEILSRALQLPSQLCKAGQSAVSAINTWLCGTGLRLLDRYKFIPQGTEEGLFESILAELDTRGLLEEDPDINNFVIAYLKHNQPTTVFGPSVQRHAAEDALQHGALLPAGQISDSLMGEASQDHDLDTMEENVDSPNGSGVLMGERETYGDQFMSSSKGDQLGDFRVGQQPGIVQAHRAQVAAHDTAEAEARRLAAAEAEGGRSRSRKRSVSKRTRRKGVAKKQKSKKNKRQSRRKVRRASSRKGRK